MELGGLWIKFGQFMASRADIMPQAYLDVRILSATICLLHCLGGTAGDSIMR